MQAVIQYIGEPTLSDVIAWKDFLALGMQLEDDALEDRLKQQAINQCCTLIYTSGGFTIQMSLYYSSR